MTFFCPTKMLVVYKVKLKFLMFDKMLQKINYLQITRFKY